MGLILFLDRLFPLQLRQHPTGGMRMFLGAIVPHPRQKAGLFMLETGQLLRRQKHHVVPLRAAFASYYLTNFQHK